MNTLIVGLVTLAAFIANPEVVASTQDSASTPHALSIPSDSAFSAVKVSRGDEMQVLSSILLPDEYFVTIHCENDACTENKVVNVLGGWMVSHTYFSPGRIHCSSNSMLDHCTAGYVHFRQDGRFLFVLMKNRHCRNVNGGQGPLSVFDDCLYRGNPQILPLAEATKQGNEVHLTYGPAHWISMRFIHDTNADAQTSRQNDRSLSSGNRLAVRYLNSER